MGLEAGMEHRLAHLEDGRGAGPDLARPGRDRGSGGAVGLVVVAGALAGMGLDRDLEAGLDEAADGLGDERDAGFAGSDFERDADTHGQEGGI